MSLKYDFFFKEKISGSEFINQFLAKKNIPCSPKTDERKIYFDVYRELGFEIYVFIEKKGFFEYEVNDTYYEYEWDPCTYISFEADKFFDHQEVKSNMPDIVVACLQRSSCDAVLLFNSDLLILDRKDGKTNANLQSTFWQSKELLARLKVIP